MSLWQRPQLSLVMKKFAGMVPPTLVFADEGKNGLCGPAPSSIHARRHDRRVVNPELPAAVAAEAPRPERRHGREQHERRGGAHGHARAARRVPQRGGCSRGHQHGATRDRYPDMRRQEPPVRSRGAEEHDRHAEEETDRQHDRAKTHPQAQSWPCARQPPHEHDAERQPQRHVQHDVREVEHRRARGRREIHGVEEEHERAHQEAGAAAASERKPHVTCNGGETGPERGYAAGRERSSPGTARSR